MRKRLLDAFKDTVKNDDNEAIIQQTAERLLSSMIGNVLGSAEDTEETEGDISNIDQSGISESNKDKITSDEEDIEDLSSETDSDNSQLTPHTENNTTNIQNTTEIENNTENTDEINELIQYHINNIEHGLDRLRDAPDIQKPLIRNGIQRSSTILNEITSKDVSIDTINKHLEEYRQTQKDLEYIKKYQENIDELNQEVSGISSDDDIDDFDFDEEGDLAAIEEERRFMESVNPSDDEEESVNHDFPEFESDFRRQLQLEHDMLSEEESPIEGESEFVGPRRPEEQTEEETEDDENVPQHPHQDELDAAINNATSAIESSDGNRRQNLSDIYDPINEADQSMSDDDDDNDTSEALGPSDISEDDENEDAPRHPRQDELDAAINNAVSAIENSDENGRQNLDNTFDAGGLADVLKEEEEANDEEIEATDDDGSDNEEFVGPPRPEENIDDDEDIEETILDPDTDQLEDITETEAELETMPTIEARNNSENINNNLSGLQQTIEQNSQPPANVEGSLADSDATGAEPSMGEGDSRDTFDESVTVRDPAYLFRVSAWERLRGSVVINI